LPTTLLKYASAWMKPAAICALRRASRAHAAALRPPEVSSALLDQLRTSHLPVRREVAFFELEKLAKQGAVDAIKAVVASLGDDTQEQELRKWALEAVKDMAEPGEDWAVSAIVRPGGPLWAGNTNIAKKAMEVLPSVADAGNALAIAALASMLSDGRFGCRAGLTIARIAEGAPSIDYAAIQAVLANLRDESRRVQVNALMALGYVGRSHDMSVIQTVTQELLAKTEDKDVEVRQKAVAALERVSGLGKCGECRKLGVLNSSEATGVADHCMHGAGKFSMLDYHCDR